MMRATLNEHVYGAIIREGTDWRINVDSCMYIENCHGMYDDIYLLHRFDQYIIDHMKMSV